MTARSTTSRVAKDDLSAWVGSRFGITLTTASSPVGLDIGDLVGLALRRNPRRAHLLVSSVLGKHLPVRPDVAVAAGRLLGELVADVLDLPTANPGTAAPVDWAEPARSAVRDANPGPLLTALGRRSLARPVTALTVLGFAETATSLGHLVADQLQAACYLHSTRRLVPGVPVTATFEEGHSHATNHLLLPVPPELLDAPGTLVLVDDELSTGTTALGTIAAVHRRRPRSHYVLACLIDLRSTEDRQRMRDLAAALSCRIDVVSLSSGRVDLPDGLLAAVTAQVTPFDRTTDDAPRPARSAPRAVRVELPWATAVPDGARHGFLAGDRAPFDAAVAAAATTLLASIRATGSRRVVVLGTEELMYLPLRLAQQLSADTADTADTALDIGFQSTTRSPVLTVDADGYPVRRQFRYADPEGDVEAARFVYNVRMAWAGFPDSTGQTDGPAGVRADEADPDLVVVVVDAAADTVALHAPGGLVHSLTSSGLPVMVAALPAVVPSPGRLLSSAPPGFPAPLTGPTFGSYAADDVRWLVTDLSDLDLEAGVADREAAIQAGTAHYAESLPVEFQPDLQYRELFDRVLAQSAERLALAVGLVTELVLQERGHGVVFASLARAGTPIGILMRRWARFRHGIDLPHYALSIVRGRGIDALALRYLAGHHDPSDVVFVDGWTGKGAIAVELTAAIADFRARYGSSFNPELAVLADPGHCVRTFGTRDDFLIASACLNSTVSGLVSRTVLNPAFLRTDQYHGAKYYRELAGGDVSNILLDAVQAAFPSVAAEVVERLPVLAASNREPTFSGWAAIEAIRAEYGIESVNFVKPGVGETTRVLLRRVPWRILVREADNPDHQHLRLLAAQRHVPIDVRPDLPYSCVGLIRRMSDIEPGEG